MKAIMIVLMAGMLSASAIAASTAELTASNVQQSKSKVKMSVRDWPICLPTGCFPPNR